MKNGIMTSIDGVSSIHVRTDEEAIGVILPERIRLVGRGVCAENSIAIDVVCICRISARVIRWEAERIEVLVGGHDREEVVVGAVFGGREMGFDNAPRDR